MIVALKLWHWGEARRFWGLRLARRADRMNDEMKRFLQLMAVAATGLLLGSCASGTLGDESSSSSDSVQRDSAPAPTPPQPPPPGFGSSTSPGSRPVGR